MMLITHVSHKENELMIHDRHTDGFSFVAQILWMLGRMRKPHWIYWIMVIFCEKNGLFAGGWNSHHFQTRPKGKQIAYPAYPQT